MAVFNKPPHKKSKVATPTKSKTRLKGRFKRASSNSLERERLVSLINSMGDGVIAVDTNLKVVVYNGAVLDLLDSNTSMHGKKISGLVHIKDKDNKSIDIADLINETKSVVNYRDYSVQYNDGTSANLYLSIAPVRLSYGQQGSEGYVLLLRDITREKSLEDERDEFISVVSHELRTPIAISEGNISNAMFVADKTGDIEQIKTALTAAHDQVTFLAEMINDLATLSRAERGKLAYEPETIDISALMAELRTNYEPQASAKGLKFIAEPPKKSLQLTSSKLYVQEILQNFITNAIKYTQTGSVELLVKPAKDGVSFAVKDSGLGISKSDQEKIFDKFFRSEDFHTRSTSGTGLGLYVTMKLTKIIHADISLDSVAGEGSTFTVDVPNLLS